MPWAFRTDGFRRFDLARGAADKTRGSREVHYVRSWRARATRNTGSRSVFRPSEQVTKRVGFGESARNPGFSRLPAFRLSSFVDREIILAVDEAVRRLEADDPESP
jgi:hypothetical protein